MSSKDVRRVAIIGNHTPRQCGIASFTADLAKAIAGAGAETQVVAINDGEETYRYPEVVTFQIEIEEPDSYAAAAQFLNSKDVDVVCVQHEYGIFGGPSGAHLLTLLREVNAPIVITLHTVLESPNADQRAVISELSQLSERFVVMSERGKAMLEEVNGIDSSKISVVPHGIPTIEREDAEPFLEKLALAGRQLLLTFGLLGPDKGIENMVKAMPVIVDEHPDAYYLVVGATHPKIRRQVGETYRRGLVDLAKELGVEENVGFVDSFVSMEDLIDYLKAASIYVTPYLKKEQITSGTLSYAFGSGKAVVSTPYWHAEELLAAERGILVPFSDPEALATEINGLLGDPMRLELMQLRAFEAGVKMRWPTVGRDYMLIFEEAIAASRSIFPNVQPSQDVVQDQRTVTYDLILDHLIALTDDTGILQHAKYNVPNRFEGYCTDDNARLAIIGAKLEDEPKLASISLWLQNKGLAFMHHAFNPNNGRMHNFLGYDRTWLDEVGSEDSHGRAMWALGVLTDESSVGGIRALARELFMKALPSAEDLRSPRGIAFTILGLEKMLAASYCGDCLRMVGVLGGRLNDYYLVNAYHDWRWFEKTLTYENARLAQGLLSAGIVLGHDAMISNAKTALNWLVQVQTDPKGYFLPIGSKGFYPRNGQRARYDQQPVEAAATMDACYDAYRFTDDARWEREVWKAFDWYMGVNSETKCMIDETTGACMDGLAPGEVNFNQGAEATLSYVSSTLLICKMEQVAATRQRGFLS